LQAENTDTVLGHGFYGSFAKQKLFKTQDRTRGAVAPPWIRHCLHDYKQTGYNKVTLLFYSY